MDIMKEYCKTFRETLKMVEERRPIVSPNKGFLRQLAEYHGILQAKMDYRRSLSEKADDGTNVYHEDTQRKHSTDNRCFDVNVKEIMESSFSSGTANAKAT